MQHLLNADILMENPDNFVRAERITNIVPNNPCYVLHSIYFADSLAVFEDAGRKKRLVLNVDYKYTSLDSVASELSNKDCYRAIIFLKAVSQAYIDYHSYGDLVSADTLNAISDNTAQVQQDTAILSEKTATLTKALQEHQKNTAPHGAQESTVPNTLALRSTSGTLQAADATDEKELTTLGQTNKNIKEAKNELQREIQKAKEEALDELDKRITDINNTLYDKNPSLAVMPLNPVCAYDMADVQYKTIFQHGYFESTGKRSAKVCDLTACKGKTIQLTISGYRKGEGGYPRLYIHDSDWKWSWNSGTQLDSTTEKTVSATITIPDNLKSIRCTLHHYPGNKLNNTIVMTGITIRTLDNGTLIDSSGNGMHASIFGSVEKVTDNAIGALLTFSGGYLSRPQQNFIGVGKQWSHSRWIKITPNEQDTTKNFRLWAYNTYDYLILDCKANNGKFKNFTFMTYKDDANRLVFSIPVEKVLTDSWHHLIVMTDLQETYCKKIVYLDNSKVAEEIAYKDFSNFTPSSGEPQNIHYDMTFSGDDTIKGAFANLLFFDRLLTEAECQWLGRNSYYPAKRYSLAEYKADENRKLHENTDQLFINIFQNGYIQWPGMPAPGSIFSFPGYRWTEVNYNGCFFRAKGYGAYSFNGGEQRDAIRDITGGFCAQGSDAVYAMGYGAFRVEKYGHVDSGFSESSDYSIVQSFSASRVVPTAEENRPRNRTFIIWKLEKI